MDTKICDNLCQSVVKNGIAHTNKVNANFLPSDWPGSVDYLSDDSHSVLIMKLLMYGGGDGNGVEIPLGKVFGIRRKYNDFNVFEIGMVKVGLEDMNRTPTSGGGQTQ